MSKVVKLGRKGKAPQGSKPIPAAILRAEERMPQVQMEGRFQRAYQLLMQEQMKLTDRLIAAQTDVAVLSQLNQQLQAELAKLRPTPVPPKLPA